MSYETITYKRKDKIVYIALNRPEIMNAVNDTMNQELVNAFREFDADQEAFVAILSGNGRCFSSGADVKQRQLRTREELLRLGGTAGVQVPGGFLGLGQTVNWKPVIAAVHKYVLGVGYGMVADCDLIVAAEDTKFQMPEVQRGLGYPHWVATWFWGGARMATEFALTGRFFSAEEAYRLGMVNRVVPLDQMMTEAEHLAEQLLATPPLAVRCNVRVTRWYVHRMREEASMYEQGLKLHLTEDLQESAQAFMEKRKPVFKGR